MKKNIHLKKNLIFIKNNNKYSFNLVSYYNKIITINNNNLEKIFIKKINKIK